MFMREITSRCGITTVTCPYSWIESSKPAHQCNIFPAKIMPAPQLNPQLVFRMKHIICGIFVNHKSKIDFR